MTQVQRQRLKKGTKLICVDEGSLYYYKGAVLTFHSWHWRDSLEIRKMFPGNTRAYFHAEELYDAGLMKHNIPIDEFDYYNPEIHTGIFIDIRGCLQIQKKFIEMYGA